MRKRGTWLKRTAWLTLGLVLMCGTAGDTVWASDLSEGGSVEQPAEGAENEGSTDSNVSTDTSTTLIVKYFDSLDPKVQTQNLEAGQDPVLPDKLGVTVGIDVQGKEEKNNSGMGASNAVQTVGEVSRLPESHITLTGVDWEVASTSETNAGTVYNYTAVLPETYGEHTVEVLNSLAQAPVISATVAPMAASNSAGGGSREATPSENQDGKWEFKGHGITVIGSEETSAVWGTQANRIRITEPGSYVIKGTLTLQGTPSESTDPFIVLEKKGPYDIHLVDVNIDISDKAYTALFSIPSGAIVNLSTQNTVKLTCSNKNVVQKVMVNNGTLNLTKGANLTCVGAFQNGNELSIADQSQLTVDGDVENGKKITISESSKMTTNNFINNGTVDSGEKGAWWNGGQFFDCTWTFSEQQRQDSNS